MKHMIIGTVILVAFIITFIIGFVIFDEPISYLVTVMSNAYPTDPMFTSHDTVHDLLTGLPTFFIAAIVTGIIMACIWYVVWGHKDEFEWY